MRCHEKGSWRRGWDSNPRTPVEMLLEFQSSAFDRSATSPHQKRAASADQARGALTRMILRPARDRGPYGASGAYSPGGAFASGTLKVGGAARHGSFTVRGGGAGSLSGGTSSAWLVSGELMPCGMASGAMLVARW